MKFTDITGKHKCDFCHETFEASEVKLVEPADNVKLFTPIQPFVFVDKDGVIMTATKQPTNAQGDKILACPKCDHTHLFGMDAI